MPKQVLQAIAVLTFILFAYSAAADTPININEADVATLAQALEGVGESRAEAIVEFREANGPFRSADDLVLVPGIGEATLERNRERIRID
jgi:competence protein ComEA